MSTRSSFSPVTQILESGPASASPEERVTEEHFNNLHASSVTYRDLLIFEERLKLNMIRLKKRQQKYEAFLGSLVVVIAYCAFATFYQPSEHHSIIMFSALRQPLVRATAAKRLSRAFSAYSPNHNAVAPTSPKLEYLLTETRGRVAVVTLHRPKALNALCNGLFVELNQVLREFDDNKDIGAIVITGSERAFAAGADIKEMKDRGFIENYAEDFLGHWTQITKIRKPTIAAVNGFALGGGCELAMMCDIIYAGDKAVFGQPEIKLGTIPGAGGTQRLVRAIGKSKAMEMCLTGSVNLTAEEAERAGLVSRVYPADQVVDEAIKTAEKIGNLSLPIVQMVKDAINQSFEVPLSGGLTFERRLFHSTFASKDQKEGMAAFAEKRKANFTHN
ncbi:putative enoyl-CoA hydratase, mitochondrial [Modicella reniformis]|uniref:Probable enoyl-CoA hydratase, mitochondrial n=1 Tax=Modicella reniformis TaxID=1440133 RepID=A0A9P6LTH7_9FUNG|nr:putative enoyl-CoA hydratase, mitochondrial [Modicella reniformis]